MAKRFTASQVRQLLNDNFSDDEAIPSDEEALPSADDEPVESDDEEDIEVATEETPEDLEEIVARDGTIWKKIPPAPNKYRRQNTIIVKSGPTVNVADRTTPANIFKYLIDDTIIDNIVENTNIRIESEKTEDYQRHHNIEHEFTNDEMYSYIGMLILLGVLKKREIEVPDLWQEGTESVHRIDHICATMSCERFKFLSRHITFDNIETRLQRAQSDPKFFKFRQVHDHIREKCKSAYEPGRDTSIDEELYPFRGRFRARQYMPKKPAKYGIKIWELVDSTTKYLVNFDVYLGKESEAVTKNLGEKVVLNLTETMHGTARNITIDNFFTSKSVAVNLWGLGLTVVGTIRDNRRELIPDVMPNRRRELYSSRFYFSDYLSLISYVPKKGKCVNLISTQHHDKHISEQEEDRQKPCRCNHLLQSNYGRL